MSNQVIDGPALTSASAHVIEQGRARADSTTPILSVRDLSIAFRTREGWGEVVRNVSFDVNAGETVAMVGESGSGKSVSALSVLKLLPERQTRIGGRIEICGRDVTTLSNREMMDIRGRDVGVIFQEPMTSLNPVYSVGYQITEMLRQHREMSNAEASAEARRLLDLVRIPDAARRIEQYPHELSGGMRQRVMIAIAMACQPKLLIADEPTTALDVTVQAQILDLLRTLQKDMGTAILFITHDMGVVAEIADRVLVMCRGDLVESGPTTDIFSAPQHAYTQMLLSAIPALGAMTGESGPKKFGASSDDPAPQPSVHQAEEPIVRVDNLVCRFPVRGGILGRHVGNVHAVEDISFSIQPGETLSLVGESGCGKSTTGRALLRLIEPTSGRVTYRGQDLAELDAESLRKVRRSIQMIFQDPFGSLNPRKTVGLAISEPMRIHGIAQGAELKDRTAQLLERVGLDPAWAARYPHQFSGGQRQRICIARALALKPDVLVADEAVSALDVSIKGQIIDLLIDLQETMGLAYLFISHDMAVVERVSHRVAVMYLGEIVETGSRAAVFERPKHPYTRKLLSAVPIPDPSRRGARVTIEADELKSPVRPLGTVVAKRPLVEVEPGHFVQSP